MRIEKKDISVKDPFEDIKTSADKAKPSVEMLSNSLDVVVELSKELKEGISIVSPKNLKELKSQNKLTSETNQLLGLKIKLDNEIKKITTETTNAIKKANAETTNSIKVRKADEDIKKKQIQTEKELIKNLEAEQKVEQQLNKTLQEVEKTKLALIKTEETRVKQEKRIQSDREKEIKALLIAEKKELDAYQKKSKRLNDLRKKYKSLLSEEGKTTRETKKLGKEVKRLDKELKDVDKSAGQFQRNVGDYPETLKSAASELLSFAAAAGVASSAVGGIKTALEDTEEGSENLRELGASLTGFFKELGNSASAIALDAFDNLSAGFKRLKGEATIDDLDVGYDRTAKATENFAEKLEDAIKGQVELTKRVIAFEKAIRPLELRIATLNGLIEAQQVIAGDSTRSFQELEDAVLKAQELQISKSRIAITIAKEELEIVQQRIALNKQGSSPELLNQETEALVKLKEAQIDLNIETLENEKELRQIKQDRLERDLDILIDGFDNQKTINERIIANDKETLERRSDLLIKTNKLANDSFREQKEVLENLSNADIDVDELLLLDATELQKQIRLLEQSEIIEGRTLEVVRERRLVLLDLKEAEEDLQDVRFESLELQADILAQEKALTELSLESGVKKDKILSDLDDKRLENEISNIRAKLEATEKGSIEELRLKQELNDALLSIEGGKEDSRYQDLLDANQEYLSKLEIQLLKAGIDRESIDKEISDKRIEQLRSELDLLIEIYGEGSKEVIDKDLELQRALESNLTPEKEYYKERESIIDGFTDKFTEAADSRIAKIDEEIAASQKQYDIYAQLAAEGNITAKESLAEQNNIIAEAEAEKAKQEQRKQNIELASSVILAYNSALESGKESPEALKDAFLGAATIKTFIAALPTFFDGTDNTGLQGKGVDGRGGFLSVNHPNETILNSEETNRLKKQGIYTRDQLFENLDSQMFSSRVGSMGLDNTIVTVQQNNNSALEKEMKNVTEAIKNIPQNNIEVAEITQTYAIIQQRKTKGNTTTTNRFKVN